VPRLCNALRLPAAPEPRLAIAGSCTSPRQLQQSRGTKVSTRRCLGPLEGHIELPDMRTGRTATPPLIQSELSISPASILPAARRSTMAHPPPACRLVLALALAHCAAAVLAPPGEQSPSISLKTARLLRGK